MVLELFTSHCLASALRGYMHKTQHLEKQCVLSGISVVISMASRGLWQDNQETVCLQRGAGGPVVLGVHLSSHGQRQCCASWTESVELVWSEHLIQLNCASRTGPLLEQRQLNFASTLPITFFQI